MQKHLLVIVDDEEDLLDLYEYNFLRKGFEVKAFTRARPALEFVSGTQPDLILCDWMMPEMTGLELCKQVKNSMSLSNIPFVMVTCRNELAARREAIAAGVTEFISKPVPLSLLLSRVSELISQRGTNEQAASQGI